MKIFRRSIFSIFLASVAVEGMAQQIHLPVQDTRSISTTPSSYAYSFEAHFKYGGSINLSEASSNPYYSVLGLRGWGSDNSGGKAHELAFTNDGNIMFRSGYSPTWDGWRRLIISDENENVGIGTHAPKEKLSVNGKVRAHEIKVETANWPDYVFAKDYQLPTLQETEKHIRDKGHLPGIPSAAEVKANGVDLGEMNARLLQKIEELTLHLIEQNKRNTENQKQIDKRLEELRNENECLKVTQEMMGKELKKLRQ